MKVGVWEASESDPPPQNSPRGPLRHVDPVFTEYSHSRRELTLPRPEERLGAGFLRGLAWLRCFSFFSPQGAAPRPRVVLIDWNLRSWFRGFCLIDDWFWSRWFSLWFICCMFKMKAMCGFQRGSSLLPAVF